MCGKDPPPGPGHIKNIVSVNKEMNPTLQNLKDVKQKDPEKERGEDSILRYACLTWSTVRKNTDFLRI